MSAFRHVSSNREIHVSLVVRLAAVDEPNTTAWRKRSP